jgi:hypothetical protein
MTQSGAGLTACPACFKKMKAALENHCKKAYYLLSHKENFL